ncbi:hypothetical protein PCASD_13648 [Puccinia coronata f. sp. avenae]|uniref:AB hydrolase-1 domain-containing protein n=1 Tax=Puccinia coronata f. sp. avenae TaxID=200324 RepID=A0A2N5U0S0_9BASI|nr:hypothetical protein PCASD_13648 [Puccinia coronata f. sp. avenae]
MGPEHFPAGTTTRKHYHYLQPQPLIKGNRNPSHCSDASTTESEDSTTDLFAGPRTSIHLDPLTGQLLSAAHNVNAMDALIDTLRESSDPKRNTNTVASLKKNNMNSSATSRLNVGSSSSAKPPRPPPRTDLRLTLQPHPPPPIPPLPPRSSSSSFGAAKSALGKTRSRSTADLSSQQQQTHLNKPLTLNLKKITKPTQPAQPSHSTNIQRNPTHPGIHPNDIHAKPNRSLHQSRNQSHNTTPSSAQSISCSLPSIQASSPSTSSHTLSPLSTPSPTVALSMNGIIEKYSKQHIQLSTVLSVPPSPQVKIDSIDEIVQKYNPILKRTTPQHHTHFPTTHRNTNQSHPKHLLSPLSDHHHHHLPPTSSATRYRSSSENSDDSHSSINSLTKEALTLQALLPNEAEYLERTSPLSSSFTCPPAHNTTSREPDLAPKPSSSPAHPSPLQPSSSTSTEDPPPSQSQIDDQIALYLRSTRLTTLLKLERQQSPMTVSLADVGSSTGHPVFVFLGLGCVRYLMGLYDELAEALGLRLICIDRWGLGKTTEVPDEQRGFLEWASVIEEVANQLEIRKFSILAHSAGAPYALACSLRFGDRVHGSIHLLAPWVSMTAEGGINAGAYKWLKYIPNSMIKTVQAAEWKMTGWRLGKPPSLNHAPVGFDVRAAAAAAAGSSSSSSSHLHEPSSQYYEDEHDDEEPKMMPKSPQPSIISRYSSSRKSRTGEDSLDPFHRMSPDSTSTTHATDTNDWQSSIGRESSMSRSRNNGSRMNGNHSQQLNHSGSGSSSSHHHHHHKVGLLGKIFPLPSSTASSSDHGTKSPDPPHFDSKVPLARRDSSNTSLAHFSSLHSNGSPVPSIVGSCEDDPDHKHRKDFSYPNGKRKMARKIKSCCSESKSIHHSKKYDGWGQDGNRKHHATMTQSSNQHTIPTVMKSEERRSGGMMVRQNSGGPPPPPLPQQQCKEGVVGEGVMAGAGIRRSLGISLLRASYSESLRGGTSDLITILEKNDKPWGFTYGEISKPVKIWHGDKDERLSPKGSQWFINSITSDRVKHQSALIIVHNATHSLMTDVNVLYQVFESIADQWTSSSSSSTTTTSSPAP